MVFFARLGMIGAVMALPALTGCGGELAPVADAPPVYLNDPGDNTPPTTTPQDGGTDDPPVTNYVPEPAATVVDLTNKDAARVCVDRAAAEKARALGKVSIEKGWNPVARAVGVEAMVWEGGSSSGGPIISHLHLDLTFPLPLSIDPATHVRTDEEFIYELVWPGTNDPKDLFLSGTTYEVDLHDKGWLRSCSAKGTYYSHNDEWPTSKVTVTIKERTDRLVSGTLERSGPYGLERLFFEAPITPYASPPTYTSPEICCLGDY